MYTRQKILSFQFLYTGGNNTCRTEQETAEKNKTQDSERKRRTEQETTEKKTKKNNEEQGE